MLKAAEVEVGRPRGHEVVVNHHHLRMQHSRLVEVDLNARVEALPHIGIGGIAQQDAVGLAGNHQAHVHLAHRRHLQRLEQAVAGQEIGRLDVDALAGAIDGLLEHKRHVHPLARGTACDELHAHRALYAAWLYHCHWLLDELALHEVPIDGKRHLQRSHDVAPHAQVSVAPVPHLAAVDVAVGNVHAAYVAYLAVDNRYLAVVAPVDAVGKLREGDLHERIHIYSRLAQLLEIGHVEVERPHVVVEHAHLHALAHLLLEYLGYLIAQLVVLDDIVLDVDIALGSEQVALVGSKLVLAVGEDLHLVVGQVGRALDTVHQVYHLLALAQRRVVAHHLPTAHQVLDVVAASQSQPLLARYHAHMPQAAAKEDVKHDTHHRQQHQHSDPRQRLYWIAVLANHNANNRYRRDTIQNGKHQSGIRKQLGKYHFIAFMNIDC